MTKVAVNKDQSAEKSRKKTAKPRGAAFKPGVSGNPSGRPKGTPNKTTTDARAAIALFINANVDKLQDWLDKVAKKSPEKAFKLFQSVIEYHIPKQARTELTGKDDDPASGYSNDELRAAIAALVAMGSKNTTPAPESPPPTTTQ